MGLEPFPWEALADPMCAMEESLLADTPMTTSWRNFGYGLLATLAPDLGLRMGSGPPLVRFQLSWPWTLPFGPPMSITRSSDECDQRLYELKPLRLLFEPGIVFTSTTTLYARPGLRFVFHPAGWSAGVGAGIATTIEALGPWGVRASVSPEMLVHWGRCCEPGFLSLSLRYDRFFAGEELNAVTTSVGFSFF
jgi:hypothetical protein